MQLDWISGTITPRATVSQGIRLYDTGFIEHIGPGGVLEWLTSAFHSVEGSYSHKLAVKSRNGFELHISGNPVKYFQGHNLFGSADARALFLAAGVEIRHRAGLFPSCSTWESCDFVGPTYSRLDITRSYRFSTDQEARTWIREVAAIARSKHGGALTKGNTVYFGKSSRHWTLKVYLKSDELKARGKGHQISSGLSKRDIDLLTDWSTGVVRFELTLRSAELERLGARRAAPENLLPVWQAYYDRVTWNRNSEVRTIGELMQAELTRAEKAAYNAWKLGEDLRNDYSKRQFYRLRKAVLDKLAIDIAAAPIREPQSGVAAGLDPDRWDPQPIEHLTFTPDKQLSLKYKNPD